MLKAAALCVSLGLTIAVSPLGCPPLEPTDPLPVDRGTIAVTASAPATAAFGETVGLQATADGDGLTFGWAQIAGAGVRIENANAAGASFVVPSLPVEQVLRFVVTVSNAAGDVGRAEVQVTIAADPEFGQRPPPGTGGGAGGGAPPRADAGEDQRLLAGASGTLDGNASTGSGLTFRWRQISGRDAQLANANEVVAQFKAPGYSTTESNLLLFELTVTDTAGRTARDRSQVTVRDPKNASVRVRVRTTLGNFDLELDDERAPVTVDNFLSYVDEGFYTNTLFHRVISGFMIQGGGFTSGLQQKQARDPIINEAGNGLSNVRGTIAMARTNDPNSATSQFFVNVRNNTAGGDGLSDLDPGGVSAEGYAVFGRVVDGLGVVDSIAGVATGSQNGFSDVPIDEVVILSIERISVDRTDSE